MNNEIDYLEYCFECGNFFEPTEMKVINGDYYCRDCSNRCAECNEMLNEEISFNKTFCSRDCYNLFFTDLYEDEWKEKRYNDRNDEF